MAEARTVGDAYDLPSFIDSQRFADSVSWERTEVAHAPLPGPQERVELQGEIPVDQVAAGVSKSDDLPVLVDEGGSVPAVPSDVAKVNRLTVFPQYGVLGAVCADGVWANARDADDLAAVIN